MTQADFSPLVFFLSLLIAIACSIYAFQKASQNQLSPWFWSTLCFFTGLPGLLLLMIVVWFKGQRNLKVSEPVVYSSQGEKEEAPPELPSLLWYYVDGEKKEKKGPFLFDELKKLYEDKVVNAQSFVWTKGMKQWQRVESLPECMQSFEDIKKPR